LPDWRPIGIAAGLHVVIRLPEGMDDHVLSRALAARGVNALPLTGYSTADIFPGLVIGYATLTPDRLRTAVGEFAVAARA
jgi:GntR family transcriptional regulator/MocR family aminotransferase